MAAEPVLVVDLMRTRTIMVCRVMSRMGRLDGFAALPHAVGTIPWARRPSFTGTRGGLSSIRVVQRGEQGLPGVFEAVRAVSGSWREGGCHAARDHPRRGADEVHTPTQAAFGGHTTLPGLPPGFALHPPRRRPRRDQGLAQHGALTVEADIRVYGKTLPLWSPPPRMGGDFSACSRAARARTSPSSSTRSASAHTASFFCPFARKVSSLCADADADIEISEVSPAVFKEVVRPPTATSSPRPTCSTADGARRAQGRRPLRGHAAQAAGRDELATRHLSVESAADLLLLADAHSCPQLKESATEFFVSKAPEVMATEGWRRLSKSADLLAELVGVLASPNKHPSEDDDGVGADRVKRMRVSELRKELPDADLDTDGARSQLEGRLREQLGRGRAGGRAGGRARGRHGRARGRGG